MDQILFAHIYVLNGRFMNTVSNKFEFNILSLPQANEKIIIIKSTVFGFAFLISKHKHQLTIFFWQ